LAVPSGITEPCRLPTYLWRGSTRPCRGSPGYVAAMAGGVGPAGGNDIIVIDPNVDRLLFLLTAAFFALAVARTAHLLFG